jgi:hypothetical protein
MARYFEDLPSYTLADIECKQMSLPFRPHVNSRRSIFTGATLSVTQRDEVPFHQHRIAFQMEMAMSTNSCTALKRTLSGVRNMVVFTVSGME